MSTTARLEAEAKYPKHLANGEKDHQAWAKQIVYRYERGDKTLGNAQIKAAREALNLNESQNEKEM